MEREDDFDKLVNKYKQNMLTKSVKSKWFDQWYSDIGGVLNPSGRGKKLISLVGSNIQHMFKKND